MRFLTPVAKRLAKRAGATALIALTKVSAIALSVPSVAGDGAISLSASCTAATQLLSVTSEHLRHSCLLKAMLTPAPTTVPSGAKIQNATFQSCLKKMLHKGLERNVTGHAMAQARKTPPVPNLRWSGGNAPRSQTACEMPAAPKNTDICSGVKPKPPSSGCVNQKTGTTASDQLPALRSWPWCGPTGSVGEGKEHDVTVNIKHTAHAWGFDDLPRGHWCVTRGVVRNLPDQGLKPALATSICPALRHQPL